TVIGSELLTDDQLDIRFTDTVTISSYNMREDSVRTFDPRNLTTNNETFPLGNFNDPLFGRASSGVYAQLTLNLVFPDFDESGSVLDSVVLVLPYDAKASYGNLDETFSLEVYQMTEPFPDTTLYSNMDFSTGQRIGTIDYRPAVNDSVIIARPGADTIPVQLAPQLRIPLNENNFHKDLFAIDTPYSSNIDEFENFLKGIYIKPISENTGMPAFKFRSTITGILVYYHLDTVYKEYLFPIFPNNAVSARYKHDYSSSAIDMEDKYVGENAPVRDSLLFLQGMSGINFVIEVPYSETLADKVLNKAELVFPIQYLPEDNPQTYPPIEQILVSQILNDGSLALIDDFTFARNREGLDGFMELFGGDKGANDTYTVNITTHLQDMSRGHVTEKMLITLFLKTRQASRVVLSGPGNSLHPAKLNLTFTNF
ncbi:MAG TPA: DUF4270 family protein, partial [Bacteroidetes bacterium]|nr:DUF4270 family protein [Bacteroidota bacterium]